MVDLKLLRTKFTEIYGASPRIFAAPGRVNLIGEHTDYNDGFVLPIAIERCTYVACSPRDDAKVMLRSLTIPGDFEFNLDHPGPKQRGLWLDYVEGVAQALKVRGVELRGANLLIDSDVPAGSGLSASAALEISAGLALSSCSGVTDLNRVLLAKAGQAAEHEYVGTMCGIMDQYISALGQDGHALLIDCRSLEPKLVPLQLGDAEVLVCDTQVKHDLATSEYNARRADCERGVELLKQRLPQITALRDVSSEAFMEVAGDLPGVTRKRCHHVVTENERTLRAETALSQGNLREFGALMYASHESLALDYEVSCPELDCVVEVARKTTGVYGARMTGGGFGGCAVVLVARSASETLATALKQEFARRFNTEPRTFSTSASAGAREIDGR